MLSDGEVYKTSVKILGKVARCKRVVLFRLAAGSVQREKRGRKRNQKEKVDMKGQNGSYLQ
jgi:hypothetical protein